MTICHKNNEIVELEVMCFIATAQLNTFSYATNFNYKCSFIYTGLYTINSHKYHGVSYHFPTYFYSFK